MSNNTKGWIIFWAVIIGVPAFLLWLINIGGAQCAGFIILIIAMFVLLSLNANKI